MRFGEMQQGADWRMRLVTGPTTEPVTIEDLKYQANYEDVDQDASFEAWGVAARRLTESRLQRALISQSWQMLLDRFPSDVIEVRICPVIAVSSVTYLDTAGASQTLPTSIYAVDTANEPGRLTLKYAQSWPTTYSQANAVTVNFTAGYGTEASAVPAEAKLAIRMLVSHWFNNREAVGSVGQNVSLAYEAILDSMRWAGYR
jgi:uncharacterized phiE125 gp8 family phage protein